MSQTYRRKDGLFKQIDFSFRTPVSPEACIYNLKQRQRNAPTVYIVNTNKRDPFTYEFTVIRNLNGAAEATGTLQLQADNSTLVKGAAYNLYGCLDYITFAIPLIILGLFGVSSLIAALDGDPVDLVFWSLAALAGAYVFFRYNRRYDHLVDDLETLMSVSNVDRQL